MNHGYCINCWWYLSVKGRYYIPTIYGLKEKLGHGKCYMQNSEEGIFSRVEGNSYCPDYINRKIGNKVQKMTLEDWIDTIKE